MAFKFEIPVLLFYPVELKPVYFPTGGLLLAPKTQLEGVQFNTIYSCAKSFSLRPQVSAGKVCPLIAFLGMCA